MYLSRNFTLEEFINSTTAKRNHIDNTPDKESIQNITILAYILQKVRDIYNKPIIIDSGYRCEELNKLVKGATNSEHLIGAAVDIRSVNDTREDNKELFDLIVNLANEGFIDLRQIINEYDYNWIHISINNRKHSVKHNEIVIIQ